MSSNKILIFLLAVVFFSCANNTNTPKTASLLKDSIKKDSLRPAAGTDASTRIEFLDTVLKEDKISYSFLKRWTGIKGYMSDSAVGSYIKEHLGEEAFSGPGLNHFEGDSVYYLSKKLALAALHYDEEAVCGTGLLFIVDLNSKKCTDYVECAYSCDGDGSYEGDVYNKDFVLPNDSELVITEHNWHQYGEDSTVEDMNERKSFVLHISKNGKFIGKKPRQHGLLIYPN